MQTDTLNIAVAFNKALKAVDPAMETAYENVQFTPKKNTPYQRVRLLPRKPQNPTLGDKFHREIGQFQIFLCYEQGTGIENAYKKAHDIREAFSRGTTLTEGNTKVIIKDTPQIGAAIPTTGRYVLPVLIEYFANVSND